MCQARQRFLRNRFLIDSGIVLVRIAGIDKESIRNRFFTTLPRPLLSSFLPSPSYDNSVKEYPQNVFFMRTTTRKTRTLLRNKEPLGGGTRTHRGNAGLDSRLWLLISSQFHR